MMKNNMIASARLKAGVPLDTSGMPFKSYTDQSESIDNKYINVTKVKST